MTRRRPLCISMVGLVMLPSLLTGCNRPRSNHSQVPSLVSTSSGTKNPASDKDTSRPIAGEITPGDTSKDAKFTPGVMPDPLPVREFQEIRAKLERDPNPPASRKELDIVRKASNDLGYELLRRLSKGHHDNVVIAPASLYASLGQLLGAARGTTKDELIKLMGPGLDSKAIHRAINRLEIQVASTQHGATGDHGPLVLRYINRLFVPQGTQPERNYLKLLARRYGTGVFEADFTKGEEIARAEINGWVKAQTQTRVAELLPRGSILKDNALHLVSALDFKAPWRECLFCSSETKESWFFPEGDIDRIDLPMVKARSRAARFGDEGSFYWISFGLGKAGLRLYWIKPHQSQIPETAAMLSDENLPRWDQDGEQCSVTMELPMFALRPASIDLKPHLKALGLKRLFGENGPAQLDGLGVGAKKPSTKLTSLMHQVSFELNRNGLEGGQGPTQLAAPLSDTEVEYCAEMWVSGPFYFIVYDEASQLVQLVGRVMNPTKN